MAKFEEVFVISDGGCLILRLHVVRTGPDPAYLYHKLVTIGVSFTLVRWGPDLLRAGPDPLGPLAGHDSHNFQDGPERSGTL